MSDQKRVTFSTGQFALDSRSPVELGKFLKALHAAELVDASKHFDINDATKSYAAQPDPDMSLETFASGITQGIFARLQIGSPSPAQIRFCINGDVLGDGSDRFAWVEAPLNERNYLLVERAFREVFKEELSRQQSL